MKEEEGDIKEDEEKVGDKGKRARGKAYCKRKEYRGRKRER